MISPAELKNRYPAPVSFIEESRRTAIEVLEKKQDRLACVVGPCSIHDLESAIEFGLRLKRLSKQLDDRLFFVMRVYCEKSRTSNGWKGLLHDPNLDGSQDIEKGIILTRRLLWELTQIGIPLAAEFIHPIAAPYIDDLITWGFIGARSSTSQPHRQMASAFPFPIGFKNTVFGEVCAAIQGIQVATTAQRFLSIDDDGKANVVSSVGNPFTHLVLRGSEIDTNFDSRSIESAQELLNTHGLPQRLMIDCSHGNSRKNHDRQSVVLSSIAEQVQAGNHAIIGFMLESHLHAGRQTLDKPCDLSYGVSITDPCMGWEEMEELLLTTGFPTSINSVQK